MNIKLVITIVGIIFLLSIIGLIIIYSIKKNREKEMRINRLFDYFRLRKKFYDISSDIQEVSNLFNRLELIVKESGTSRIGSIKHCIKKDIENGVIYISRNAPNTPDSGSTSTTDSLNFLISHNLKIPGQIYLRPKISDQAERIISTLLTLAPGTRKYFNENPIPQIRDKFVMYVIGLSNEQVRKIFNPHIIEILSKISNFLKTPTSNYEIFNNRITISNLNLLFSLGIDIDENSATKIIEMGIDAAKTFNQINLEKQEEI